MQKSQATEAKRRKSHAIKVAKEYESNGERKTKFAPVGWLTPVDDGKIAFYVDIDLLSGTRLVVFRDEEDGQ
ncbi:MAG: hypothetical protein IT381_33055 [Deltaproteobacteria bacterium]|nr:hypothetical protein [Deltaproteobacteria bacterium]